MHKLGEHLIVEFYGVDTDLLNDRYKLLNILVEAAKNANSIVLDTESHMFSPHGVSCMVIIKESHLSIHTWPELKYAAVDIYTCGDHTDPYKALDTLVKYFQPDDMWQLHVDRGIRNGDEFDNVKTS